MAKVEAALCRCSAAKSHKEKVGAHGWACKVSNPNFNLFLTK